MKKISILLIIILMVGIFSYIVYYTSFYSEIIGGPATLSSQEVSNFNSKFEKYIGSNTSQNIEELLKYCLENYLDHFEECALVPQIKYKSQENEKIISFTFDNYKNASYSDKENADYYISINNIIQSLSDICKYEVKVNYDKEHNFDNTFLINEIEIIEIKQ